MDKITCDRCTELCPTSVSIIWWTKDGPPKKFDLCPLCKSDLSVWLTTIIKR